MSPDMIFSVCRTDLGNIRYSFILSASVLSFSCQKAKSDHFPGIQSPGILTFLHKNASTVPASRNPAAVHSQYEAFWNPYFFRSDAIALKRQTKIIPGRSISAADTGVFRKPPSVRTPVSPYFIINCRALFSLLFPVTSRKTLVHVFSFSSG